MSKMAGTKRRTDTVDTSTSKKVKTVQDGVKKVKPKPKQAAGEEDDFVKFDDEDVTKVPVTKQSKTKSYKENEHSGEPNGGNKSDTVLNGMFRVTLCLLKDVKEDLMANMALLQGARLVKRMPNKKPLRRTARPPNRTPTRSLALKSFGNSCGANRTFRKLSGMN